MTVLTRLRRTCCPNARPLSSGSLVLTVALVSLVASRSVDQVLYYRIAAGLQHYNWYFSAVILPIGFLVVCWPVVWYKMLCTRDITPAMRAFPHKKFILYGGLDTLFNILSTWPVDPLGGTLTNVLGQTVLPINMVFSFWLLKTRYRKVHYIGAFLAIYGVLVRLIPNMLGARGSGTATGGAVFLWSLVLIAANIPNALSNVFKEGGLKTEADMDVWYMNAWIGVYQTLWGFVTFWSVFIPLTADSVAPSEFFSYIANANKCFFGDNGTDKDDCSALGIPVVVFTVFICFNIAYNLLMLYTFKRGSSVLFVIANAVRLPLVDLLLMIPFLAGKTEAFTLYDGFALAALLLAILTYYSEAEKKSPDAKLSFGDQTSYFTEIDGQATTTDDDNHDGNYTTGASSTLEVSIATEDGTSRLSANPAAKGRLTRKTSKEAALREGDSDEEYGGIDLGNGAAGYSPAIGKKPATELTSYVAPALSEASPTLTARSVEGSPLLPSQRSSKASYSALDRRR